MIGSRINLNEPEKCKSIPEKKYGLQMTIISEYLEIFLVVILYFLKMVKAYNVKKSSYSPQKRTSTQKRNAVK